jgi:hypothetical protein
LHPPSDYLKGTSTYHGQPMALGATWSMDIYDAPPPHVGDRWCLARRGTM